MRSRIAAGFVGLAMMVVASTADAGFYSGQIESVSVGTGQVVIRLSSNNRKTTYSVSSSSRLTINRKRVLLRDFQPGMRVSVVTNSSGKVTSISGRAASRPSTPSTTPSTTPRPTPSPSPTSPTPRPTTPRTTQTNRSTAGEWASFRGPNGDNLSKETGLLKQWPSAGPRLAWTGRGLGAGYSAVSISNGRIYTMGQAQGQQAIGALDLATGRGLWAAPIGGAYNDGMGDGPRGTPSIVDGVVYGLSGAGDLAAVDADSGQIRWRKNILQEFGGSNIGWGISESVLIDGEKLICTPGGSRGTVVALNKDSGSVIWRSVVPGTPKAGYASPVIATVGGVKQYVVFTHNGVVGIRANDGEPMWGENAAANGTANAATPLVIGDKVFSSSDYGTGCALVQLQSRGNMTTSRLLYSNRNMKNHHGGMVAIDGYIYGSNGDIFSCIDVETGEPTWQQRGMKGSVVYADGHLYFRNEGGPVSLIEANPDQFREKGRFNQPNRSDKAAWAHPVIADGKLFLRDQDTLLAFDLRN